jgi:beta-lactam-binding protein with PASTA domain
VVPRVIGLKLKKAKKRIRARQCRVGKVVKKHSSFRLVGRVIKQRPAPGRRLRRGAKVNLTVGKR